MTPHPPAQVRARPGRRLPGMLGVVLPVMISAAACSAPPAPATPAITASAAGAEASQTASAGTSGSAHPSAASTAAGSQPTALPGIGKEVQSTLEALVRSSPQPSREQVRSALSAADFDPASVEVSASRTPTGLGVEAVEAAVLTAGQCAVAQIRSGTVEVSVLPVLSNGRCFLGTGDK